EQSLTRWQFAPSVNAFARWERIYSEPPFGNPPFTRTFGVQASWDLWDNGARVFATQEAAAKTQKSQAALKEMQEQVGLETSGLMADLRAAKETLKAAKAAVDQADEAYRLDKARFASGLITATDLLLSEATETKARGNLVMTLTEVHRLALNLE